MKRSRSLPVPLLLFLCLLPVPPSCGTEEAPPDGSSSGSPDPEASCATLEPLALQDPSTGGSFHCYWCNREWNWMLPADEGKLFVLIALTCDRLGSDAYLEIRDARSSVLWQRSVHAGDHQTDCIELDAPPTDVLSVRLRGTRTLLFVHDLIEEFRGSLHLKLVDAGGRVLPGPLP